MSRGRARVLAGVRVGLAVVGLAVLVAMVRAIGVAELARVIAPALVWLPVVVLLEGVRIGCDAASTRLVLGERGREIPFRSLYVAQVAAHGVMNVAPAGRTASEAVKAMLLTPWLGAAPAVAMGLTNQANVLISSAFFSLLCIAGAPSAADPGTLALVLGVHAATLFAAGVGLRVLATNRPLASRFVRFFPRARAPLERFADASRDTKIVAAGPLATMFAGRVVQTIEYAILATAVGLAIGPLEALAVQGVNLVAAVLGTVVPGQIGSSEAAFALAAGVLGTSVAQATAIALLAHAVQLAWVLIGLVLLALFRARRRVDARANAS